MTDDLVKRLRSVDISWSETGEWCAEAADRIEQLEREKAVVSDLWEQQKEIALGYLADCDKAADRIEALEAENDGLRGVERAAIVAWLRKLSGYDATTPTFQDRRLAYQLAALEFSSAIEAGEHLK